MRFEARVNRIFLVCWSILMISGGVLLMVGWHQQNYVRCRIPIHYGVFDVLFWLSLLATCLLVFTFRVPQFCELQEDGLFFRRGWRKNLIPYDSIYELLPISPSLDCFWTSRVLIFLANGKTLSIPVSERERFLAEAFRKRPQLEHKATSFGV